jgi:hypothetical protein
LNYAVTFGPGLFQGVGIGVGPGVGVALGVAVAVGVGEGVGTGAGEAWASSGTTIEFTTGFDQRAATNAPPAIPTAIISFRRPGWSVFSCPDSPLPSFRDMPLPVLFHRASHAIG